MCRALDRSTACLYLTCTACWAKSFTDGRLGSRVTFQLPACPPTLQDLLGESFRRQMLMDGQFGQISFVCTKADNIM